MNSNFVRLYNKIHFKGFGRALLILIVIFAIVFIVFSIFENYKLCAVPIILLAGIATVRYTDRKMIEEVWEVDQLHPGFREFFKERRTNNYKQTFGCLGAIFTILFGLIIPAASQGLDDANKRWDE
jgi:hypothetical protein